MPLQASPSCRRLQQHLPSTHHVTSGCNMRWPDPLPAPSALSNQATSLLRTYQQEQPSRGSIVHLDGPSLVLHYHDEVRKEPQGDDHPLVADDPQSASPKWHATPCIPGLSAPGGSVGASTSDDLDRRQGKRQRPQHRRRAWRWRRVQKILTSCRGWLKLLKPLILSKPFWVCAGVQV